MSVPQRSAIFAKSSLERKLVNVFLGLSAIVIAAVFIGFWIREQGASESLVTTVFSIGALSGFINTYVLLSLVLTLRFKETVTA